MPTPYSTTVQTRGPSLVCDDVLHWAETYQGQKFHAMLLDPPYGLAFMGASWDDFGRTKPYKPRSDEGYGHKGILKGYGRGGTAEDRQKFHAKSMQGYEAFMREAFTALARHLLPGAFIMAFASSRGYHRLACAMEDAGLILHPSIFNYHTGEVIDVPSLMGWSAGSGFPKATRIDTQVDYRNGEDLSWFGPWLREWREKRGISQKELAQHFPSKTGGHTGRVANWELGLRVPPVKDFNKLVEVLGLPFATIEEAQREVVGKISADPMRFKTWVEQDGHERYTFSEDLTAPATPLAQAWAGHRYGGQCLKPALEPVIVAQVPYSGRPVDSIARTGAGSLWIEGGRIGTESVRSHGYPGEDLMASMKNGGVSGAPDYHTTNGRWPANFCLQHLPGCQRVGETRVRNGSGPASGPTVNSGTSNDFFSRATTARTDIPYYTAPDGTETVQAWVCAEGCPVAAFDGQAGERRSGAWNGVTQQARIGQTSKGDELMRVREDREPSLGSASRFFFQADWSLDVAEQLAQADPVRYCAKSSRAERDSGLEGRNSHPTLKPISLCTWLATLLLPPAAYAPRRLLVPFSGTSSEIIGGLRAGFEMVLGIEQDPRYVEIGRKRVAWWTGHIVAAPDYTEMAQQETTATTVSQQLTLF